MRRVFLMRSAAMVSPLLLAACGGGGSGGAISSTPPPPAAELPTPTPVATPTPTPSPAPTPTPTPTTTPTATPSPTASTNNNTAEYRATVGAVSMNALAAYDRGATGAGISIAVIDSGIDLQSAEFTGRIAAASQSVGNTTTIDDEGGHGTAVAFTAAGRRNGTGTQGVAPDATLVVLRADTDGSCRGGAGSSDSGCSFSTDAIARGVDAARTAGARVINLSLGGTAMPANLVAAINRATAQGIVIVVAAGNDGAAEPDAFSAVANNGAAARNLVIIAGSVDANNNRTAGADTISTYSSGGSNRAGASAAHYLAAVGARVQAPDGSGTNYLWSGTSFSAPQIAGAVALLAQAFPNLTGAQIVDLLYRTARDAGAVGVDGVYGNGVLDLTRAFQPVGAVTVAGSQAPLADGVNATLSTAMGDAAVGTLGSVILDSYGRAFAADLAAGGIARAATPRTLYGALSQPAQTLSLAHGGTAMALTVAMTPRRDGGVSVERMGLAQSDARGARAIAGLVTQRLGPRTVFGLGFQTGAGTLTQQLSGQGDPAFLVARSGGLGFDAAAGTSAAVRRQIGGWGLTAAFDTGRVLTARDRFLPGRYWDRSGYVRQAMTVDRRVGPLALTTGVIRLDEARTVLGARFSGGLGAPNATSWFVDGGARLDAGGGWTLGGSWRQGWTRANGRDALVGGAIRTDAFAADIGKAGLLGGDSVGLRIAQPLRVVRGGLDFTLPTYWDYTTGSVASWATQRFNLAPTGRELDVEARYAVAWGGGDVQGNLFWRRDPGNIAALAPDYGIALRFSRPF